MTAKLEIIEAIYDTPLYQELVELRYRILRQPLGLKFTGEQLLAEKNEIHLAALIEKKAIGCMLLSPQNNKIIKFRQMAIDPMYRGQGFGKLLLDRAERIAVDRGYQSIVLHAREVVVDFYKKAGYKSIGKPFIEVTIPHVPMEKILYC